MAQHPPNPAERSDPNHDQNAYQRRSDPLAGWPTGKYDPLTPAGEFEQTGKLLSGLARQKGWRLVVARTLAAVVLLLILAFIVLGVASV